tara:strand:+ start:4342 stop:4893 length:552 start_codon:yes stop_codon:yes gene_type:complete
MKRFISGAALVLSGAVLLVIALNLYLPVKLRFAAPALNYWAVWALAVSLPFAVATLLAALLPAKRWIGSGVAWFLCAAPCSIFSLFAYYEAASVQAQGEDGSFMLLDSVVVDSVDYRLYLSNCGATCSWGLVVRAERDGPLGTKVVRSIWSAYKTLNEAHLIQAAPGALRVVEKDGTAHDLRY